MPSRDGDWLTIPRIGASAAVTDRSTKRLVGCITKLMNAAQAVPGRLSQLEDVVLPDLRSQLERTEAKSGGPFARADELRAARTELDDLRTTLEERYSDPDPASASSPPAAGTSVDADLDAAVADLRAADTALDERGSPSLGTSRPPSPRYSSRTSAWTSRIDSAPSGAQARGSKPTQASSTFRFDQHPATVV